MHTIHNYNLQKYHAFSLDDSSCTTSKKVQKPLAYKQVLVKNPPSSFRKTILSQVLKTMNPNAFFEKAIEEGDIQTVTELLDNGHVLDDPRRIAKGSLPALVLALVHGVSETSIAMARLLISRGANLNIVFAAKETDCLSSCCCEIPSETTSLISYYIHKEDLRGLQAMIDLGAPLSIPDSRGRTPFSIICGKLGYCLTATSKAILEEMKIRLEHGMRENTRDFHNALISQDRNALEDLLKNNPLVRYDEEYLLGWKTSPIITILKSPFSARSEELLSLLKDSSKRYLHVSVPLNDTETSPYTSLVGYYVEKRDLDRLRKVLIMGAPTEIRDSEGLFPLQKAKNRATLSQDPIDTKIVHVLQAATTNFNHPLSIIAQRLCTEKNIKNLKELESSAQKYILCDGLDFLQEVLFTKVEKMPSAAETFIGILDDFFKKDSASSKEKIKILRSLYESMKNQLFAYKAKDGSIRPFLEPVDATIRKENHPTQESTIGFIQPDDLH